MKNPLRVGAKKLSGITPDPIRKLFQPYRTSNMLKQLQKRFEDTIPDIQRNRIFENDIRIYWKEKLGLNVNPAWHLLYTAFTNNEDVRFVSQFIWKESIHHSLNNPDYFYPIIGDKNFADILFGVENLPKTVVKRIRSRFYDETNKIISRNEAFTRIRSYKHDKIVKPSMSCQGQNVYKLDSDEKYMYLNGKTYKEFDFLGLMGDDFIVQHKVEQHPVLAAPHPSSLNSIRICTMRLGNDIIQLPSVMKFGTKNRITDNTSLIMGIEPDGTLTEAAYNFEMNALKNHPTTGYSFSKLHKVPNFLDASALCKELHQNILHMDFAAWDVAITPNCSPIIIEVNSNPSVWSFQFVNKKPFFGDYTEEVLHWVCSRQNNR